MAKIQQWQDDDWLLLMQLYLKKPVGIKPMYSKAAIELCLELHIPPQIVYQKMCAIANLETPRIERIWNEYAQNPRRLSRAVKLLRQMKAFGNDDFYEGVDIQETFETDFRPIAPDTVVTPIMLIIILDLYFRLTPITMVVETPEIQSLFEASPPTPLLQRGESGINYQCLSSTMATIWQWRPHCISRICQQT